jgi:Ca2+-binding RTX toxin-like protein
MRRNQLNRFRKFELLEDRRMKAGDISYDNGILTITGAGYKDTAHIRFEGDQVHVDLDVGESGGGTDHHDKDKDIEDVTRIVFNGFAGDDTVTVDVASLDSGVTLDNITLEFHGGEHKDTLTQTGGGVATVANGDAGNDTLQGSRFNDTLTGGADSDTLDAGAGDDIMDGGAGNDTYIFAGSIRGNDQVREAANVDRDTLDFSNFNQSFGIDFSVGYGYASGFFVSFTDSTGQAVNSTGVEDVYGSAYSDTILGNSRENHFYGQGGKDTLEGRGGNDTLDGGSESDTYRFSGTNLGTDTINETANSDNDILDFGGMTHGVRVDLSKTGSWYAVNNADLKLSLSNDTAIERVYGTDYDDVLLGNSRDNYLYGGHGVDSLQGMAGVDELHGGADNDILYVDSLDIAYGEAGDDWIGGYRESTSATNHRPGLNRDWGLI